MSTGKSTLSGDILVRDEETTKVSSTQTDVRRSQCALAEVCELQTTLLAVAEKILTQAAQVREIVETALSTGLIKSTEGSSLIESLLLELKRSQAKVAWNEELSLTGVSATSNGAASDSIARLAVEASTQSQLSASFGDGLRKQITLAGISPSSI